MKMWKAQTHRLIHTQTHTGILGYINAIPQEGRGGEPPGNI